MTKVLQVVGALNPGGAETWYVNVLRHIDRNRFEQTFCCLSNEVGSLEPEILSLGPTIIRCPRSAGVRRFGSEFRRILREGSYDVVHSHNGLFAGLVLKLAAQAGVPVRIAHARSSAHLNRPSLIRKVYSAIMRRQICRWATCGLAVSDLAGDFMFGKAGHFRRNMQILPSGIDTDRFAHAAQQPHMRRELGLDDEALVVGHVGNLRVVKNHRFLLQVMAMMVRRLPQTRLILVGEGEEKQRLIARAADLGIGDKVIFLGSRSDVPDLMQNVFDLMIFPSISEGLPQAVVEAQCSGLGVLLADHITKQVQVIPELLRWASLSEGPDSWARVAIEQIRLPRFNRNEACTRIKNSHLDISYHVAIIEKLYSSQAV